MKEINLLIIEDNRLLRDGLKAMLRDLTDFIVETAAGNGENVLKTIIMQQPNILLVDVGLPEHDIFEFLMSIKAKYPELKIIMMGLVPVQEEVLQYIEAGVSGFILKDATIEDFIKTIRLVADGEKVLPTNMTKSLFSLIVEHAIKQYGASKLIKSVRLTMREREVVTLIANGLTNKEIADKMNLSIYTIKSHVHNILEKMALNTRVQIAIYASTSDEFQVTDGSTPPNDK